MELKFSCFWTLSFVLFLFKTPFKMFTMKVEAKNILPFLDVLIMNRGPKLATKVYGNPTHARRYLHLKSQPPISRKQGSLL
jgi:hypothetical protein